MFYPEELVERLTAADIYKILKKQNPAAMRGISPNLFSQSLAPAGFSRHRGHSFNYYPVVSLNK